MDFPDCISILSSRQLIDIFEPFKSLHLIRGRFSLKIIAVGKFAKSSNQMSVHADDIRILKRSKISKP